MIKNLKAFFYYHLINIKKKTCNFMHVWDLEKKILPKDLLEENNLKDFKILKYFNKIELKQDNNARMSLFQIE